MSSISGTILCVLSTMSVKDRKGDPLTLSELSYTVEGEAQDFRGVQTNEAPVKYLLTEAHKRGQDIKNILCLRSNKCAQPSIPLSSIESFLPEDSPLRNSDFCSAESFFCERIFQYCKEQGIPAPTTDPISYNPGAPSDSLATIAEYLGSNFRVSIDMTGGPRDAAVLMTFAAEIVKFNAEDNDTGPIVYCNLGDKRIVDLRDTFGLVELVSAIDSFTEHGDADALCKFFNVDDQTVTWVTQETKNACVAMRDFANDLALCRTWQIDSDAKRVQSCLDKASQKLEAKKSAFEIASEGLRALRNPETEGFSTEEEVVAYLGASDIASALNLDDPGSLPSKLEWLKTRNSIAGSELLFLSLIDTIRTRFVSASSDRVSRTLATIRWCAERKMVMQALSIFREEISNCLIEMGYFSIDNQQYSKLKSSGKYDKRKIDVRDLCCHCSTKRGNTVLYIDDDKFKQFASVVDANLQLIESVAWFNFLRAQRNAIVHVDSITNDRNKKLAEKALGIAVKDSPTIEDLQSYLIRAVECIEALPRRSS